MPLIIAAVVCRHYAMVIDFILLVACLLFFAIFRLHCRFDIFFAAFLTLLLLLFTLSLRFRHASLEALDTPFRHARYLPPRSITPRRRLRLPPRLIADFLVSSMPFSPIAISPPFRH